MKNLFLFSILSLTFLLSSCKEKETYVWVKHLEIKCGEKWGTGEGSSSAEVETAINTYFDDLSLSFQNFELPFDQNLAEDCEACDCKTGRTIRLEINETDVNSFQTEGFSLE